MFDSPFSKDFKNRRIPLGFKENVEPNEILLDSLAQRKEREAGFSRQKFEVPLFKKTFQAFFVFCAFLIFILFAKTFQLQVAEGKKYVSLADANKFIVRQIQAERGVIYDRNFTQLVFNKPSFDLILYKNELSQSESEKERVLEEVAAIINKNSEDLKKQIKETQESVLVIFESIPHQELILLESKINELTGFQISQNPVREYQDGEVFASIIGYTGKITSEEFRGKADLYSINDYVGRAGLENYYEDALHKKSGQILVERDVLGNIKSKEIGRLPESGDSLVLWLDAGLQKKLKEEMTSILAAVGAKKAAAVALDPKTGGVLALISLPTFDNNLFQKGADPQKLNLLLNDPYKTEPLFNRAVSGIGYPTGSTIKPFVGLAALEEGVINANTTLPCPLEICIKNPWYPGRQDCYADWKYHGPSNLIRAIAESVNTFFYQIGGGYENFKGLGVTKIKKWLEIFGWDAKTGIDLPKEGQGILPNLENDWRLGDTYHFSIGQGAFSATPLQVVTAYQAVANGGTIYQPRIVKEIIDSDKNVVKKTEQKILEEIPAKKENLQIVREGMRQAVISPDGSSHILSFLPFSAAAKTGTAQTSKEEVYHNWVTVFAPYENPQIVLTIVIEDVRGMQAAALPIAKNVLEWYFNQERNF